MNQISVHAIELPGKIKGTTIEIADDFIVFINSNLNPSCQTEALRHELRHIKKDHFYDESNVILDEMEANTEHLRGGLLDVNE